MDKKKVVNTTKKVTKVTKKENKKLDYKKVVANEKFLLGVFVLLAVFVCILGCFVIKEMNGNRVIDKTNVVLPIVEENTNNALEIDAYGLTKERFYVIKVTNYHEKDINKDELEYTIDIENETKATIKVTKNDDETNLIKNNKKTVITGQKLGKDKKQDDYYYVSIVHDGGVVQNDTIKITFSTKK
jgi:hypothetical protein